MASSPIFDPPPVSVPVMRKIHRLEADAFGAGASVPLFRELTPRADFIVNAQAKPQIERKGDSAANFCLIVAVMMFAMMLGGLAYALVDGRLL